MQGYAHGLRYRLPYKCPWWADSVTYSRAYMDGYRQHDGKREVRAPIKVVVVIVLSVLSATAVYSFWRPTYLNFSTLTDVSSQLRVPAAK